LTHFYHLFRARIPSRCYPLSFSVSACTSTRNLVDFHLLPPLPRARTPSPRICRVRTTRDQGFYSSRSSYTLLICNSSDVDGSARSCFKLNTHLTRFSTPSTFTFSYRNPRSFDDSIREPPRRNFSPPARFRLDNNDFRNHLRSTPLECTLTFTPFSSLVFFLVVEECNFGELCIGKRVFGLFFRRIR